MKHFILGIFILLFISGLIYFSATRTSEEFSDKSSSVSLGNTVQVMYTGKLENGTVFDTSIAEMAQIAGIHNPLRTYEPLEFVVGSGQMIPGFDRGVLGMKIGEKKILTLLPRDAYGEYISENVQVIPRTEIINRTQEFNKSLQVTEIQFQQLFQDELNIGMEYSSPQSPWKYEVKKIEEGIVFLDIITKKGDILNFPGAPWSSEVIEAGMKIIIRHNPRNKQVITIPLGNATLEVSSKEIKIKVDPIRGAILQGPFGQSIVKDFNSTDITLDLNHPLAGKTLIFEIEVINITESPLPLQPLRE